MLKEEGPRTWSGASMAFCSEVLGETTILSTILPCRSPKLPLRKEQQHQPSPNTSPKSPSLRNTLARRAQASSQVAMGSQVKQGHWQR